MPLEIIIHFMMHVHLLNPLRSGGHLVVASKGVKCACSCVQKSTIAVMTEIMGHTARMAYASSACNHTKSVTLICISILKRFC